MSDNVRKWIHGLAAFVIGGVATTGVGYMSSANPVDWPLLGKMALASAVLSVLLYLKQSPLPDEVKRVAAVLLAVLLLAAPAHAGARPDLNVTGIVGVAHDVASGWQKPTLFAAECVVGPHWGPLYFGGACTTQGSDGLGSGVVFLSYVGQGYIHGLFRSVTLTAGQRRQSLNFSGSPGYFVLLGVGR